MRVRYVLGSAWLALLVMSPAGEGAGRAIPVRPRALPGTGSSLVWEAPQFIQADGKGRVFVLRTDTLEVYPVTRRGELGDPERLERGGLAGGKPLGAAMSSSGSEWVVWNGSSTPLSFFRNGKQQELPSPAWKTNSVGLLAGDPVVGVLPVWVGRQLPPGFKAPQPPPLVVTYSAARWSPLLSEDLRPGKDDESPHSSYLVHRSTLLLGDAERKLWVAQLYAYHVRRFSAAGKLLLEIKVGPGEPQPTENPAEADAKLLAEPTGAVTGGSGSSGRLSRPRPGNPSKRASPRRSERSAIPGLS